MWVLHIMEGLGLTARDILLDTGLDKSTISLLHGRRNMTKPTKAMFYYYLKFTAQATAKGTKIWNDGISKQNLRARILTPEEAKKYNEKYGLWRR